MILDISQLSHLTTAYWFLNQVQVSSGGGQFRLQWLRGRSLAHHEEERPLQVLEDVHGVGGDRVDPRAPGQGVEPRLADHIQVRGDVH